VQVTTLQYMEQLKLALASASSLDGSIYPTLSTFLFFNEQLNRSSFLNIGTIIFSSFPQKMLNMYTTVSKKINIE